MESLSCKSNVFNIQSYSIHDGPGIRTTVFFKGCPLRCKWCQNPESQSFIPELMVHHDRCVGCGACAVVCPHKAVEIIDGKAITNRALCKSCGACVSVCAVSAREICGKSMTVDEVFERVVEDKIFFQGSGGGVTASGGEALSHADFVRELFVKCHDAGIHTTLDTSGYADWKVLEKLVDCTDLFLFDIKHMDDQKHRELTAVSNVKILENAKKLVFLGKEVFIRLPIIPTMNDSDENMEATAEFVEKELGGKPRVALLAYHRLGDSKLDDLERADEFLGLQPPSEERMQYLKSLFEKHGLKVQIGG